MIDWLIDWLILDLLDPREKDHFAYVFVSHTRQIDNVFILIPHTHALLFVFTQHCAQHAHMFPTCSYQYWFLAALGLRTRVVNPGNNLSVGNFLKILPVCPTTLLFLLFFSSCWATNFARCWSLQIPSAFPSFQRLKKWWTIEPIAKLWLGYCKNLLWSYCET